MVTPEQHMLRHFLAVLAYRAQKAVRDAPPGYLDFQAGRGTRTPSELLDHMTQLMSFAEKRLAGSCRPPDERDPIERFHQALDRLSVTLSDVVPETDVSRRLLQGPLADAMTHVGQLAMLRRLAQSPIAGESFYKADIEADNTSSTQALDDD